MFRNLRVLTLYGADVRADVNDHYEFGAQIVRDPVGIHDLQATIMHLMGFDHEQLTFTYNGRPFRLTDVAGRVIREIVA